MTHNNLSAARKNKNDEFYTLLPDIENELKWYKEHFKDKVVYCNCDNVNESNFVKFFEAKFEDYGLKKLIATGYKEGALATEMYEKTSEHNKITMIHGNGSYSSPACLKLLEEADIVVTNPPFSLFREYVAKLYELEKQFLIIGNNNAITYKEIYPLIKENKLWLGINNNKTLEFKLHESYNRWNRLDQKGNKYGKVPAISWFTNLKHYKRNANILLYKNYSKEEYPTYDNYNVIDVSKVRDIPMDYQGAMGVPITFLDKYSPSQFEILGLANNVRSIGFDCKTIINGRPVYNRIIIKHKKVNDEN